MMRKLWPHTESQSRAAHQVIQLPRDEALEHLAVRLLAQLAQPLLHIRIRSHAVAALSLHLSHNRDQDPCNTCAEGRHHSA